MRLILSRKGFDSSAGGVASPILPDGRLLSLPIPVDNDDLVCFDDIPQFRQRGSPRPLQGPRPPPVSSSTLGPLVEDLTKGAVKRSHYAHLDPDLRYEARSRMPGWLPAFGQSEAAARHLELQGVREGDIFLFFGWFRQTSQTCKGLGFTPRTPDLHVLFGWLQVGSILRPKADGQIPAWLATHPHVSGHSATAARNLIFIATPHLNLDGLESDWPGGGVFERFSPALCLTAAGARLRSHWTLPAWFNREPRLSYHGNNDRWVVSGEGVQLRTVGRGQEFVFDCGESREPARWIRDLLRSQLR